MMTEVQLDSFRRGGYSKYEWIAEIDHRTCPICEAMDGRVFDAEKSAIGGNLPPLHPFCRCSVAAYVSDEESGELFSRNGEDDIGVPASAEEITQMTKKFRKHGGEVLTGEEIDIHLQNMQEAASFIASGDGKSAILISEKTTRAQLAEELRHWQQERWGLYGDFPQLEKEILREIEAKKFVISKAKLYII